MFLSAWSLLLCLLLAVPGVAGPVGIFQGELISGPQAGWLYVKGRNGMLRRVKLGKARIVYGRTVPLERRDPNPSDDLIKGAVVKVTAEQGSDGEWRARKVVLVHLSANLRDRERATTAAAKLSTSLDTCN
ncbi:MAG: hypothetical protein ABI383_09245 [Acidobacteriaceae bacterium]